MMNRLSSLILPLFLLFGSSAFADPSREAAFIPVSSLVELGQEIAKADGKPVLLRVRADWNISDGELDETYDSACVQETLTGIVVLVIDVTDNTEDQKAVMEKFGIYGPPTALMFDGSGEKIPDSDIIGYLRPPILARRIREALGEDAVAGPCVEDEDY